VALALARQRIMTTTFPYYKLAHPEKGVSGAFIYKTVPHITLRSIAQNEPPEQETLYDQPEIDRSKVRVSGPFTVEAIPVPAMESPAESPIPQIEADERETAAMTPPQKSEGRIVNPAADHITTMFELLLKAGVNFQDG
jgi:adenine-specific DNA-methyltransferase